MFLDGYLISYGMIFLELEKCSLQRLFMFSLSQTKQLIRFFKKL